MIFSSRAIQAGVTGALVALFSVTAGLLAGAAILSTALLWYFVGKGDQ